MCLEAKVRRATVTSSRRRAGVQVNEGQAASLAKKYQGLAIASRREAVTRFVQCNRSRSGKRTHAPVRDAAVNRWHCLQEGVINDVVEEEGQICIESKG